MNEIRKLTNFLSICYVLPFGIEELDRKKLDADLLKDFVSGGKLTVEILYGTKVYWTSPSKTCDNFK